MALFIHLRKEVMSIGNTGANPAYDIYVNLLNLTAFRKSEGSTIVLMIGRDRETVQFITEEERDQHFNFIVEAINRAGIVCGINPMEKK